MAYGLTKVAKGKLVRIEEGVVVDTFTFQFNPTNYSRQISTDWVLSESPGQYLPVARFGKFGNRTIDFQLFLYSRESAKTEWDGLTDVDKQMDKLETFCSPGTKLSADTPQHVSPGRMKLQLGARTFNGVVNSLSMRHTMFNREFETVMGTVDVQFTITSFGFNTDLSLLNKTRYGLEFY